MYLLKKFNVSKKSRILFLLDGVKTLKKRFNKAFNRDFKEQLY